MTASDILLQRTPPRIQSALMICTAVMLPLGAAVAQDYQAVERRLGEAVAGGELSLQQAAHMMEVLKHSAHEEHRGGPMQRIEGWIKDVGDRIKSATEQGHLSEEDAWAKWNHFKKTELAPKLKACVAKGEVSREWVRDLWKGIDMAEAGEKLKAAVAKGEMTEKEAKTRWRAIEEKAHQAERPDRDRENRSSDRKARADKKKSER